jgi:hypothetical protein
MRAGSLRTSSATGNTTAAARRAIRLDVDLQPLETVRLASTGRKTSWPAETAAPKIPITRPLRFTNHRLARVAPSTEPISPVPSPLKTPKKIELEGVTGGSGEGHPGGDDHHSHRRNQPGPEAVDELAGEGSR